MSDSRDHLRVVVFSVLLLGSMVTIAPGLVGTVAATDTAPTCNTVSYTQNASGFYEVTNVSQLQCIEDNGLDQNYVLTEDIDASGTVQWGAGGFEPIGIVFPFEGRFDGNGYTISGLYIDRPGLYDAGLFANLGSSGTLTNVGLENVTVEGFSFVGGLVGVNDDGTVRSSYATGSSNGSSSVGGLIGQNSGTVRSSYATSSVDGTDYVGGLIGISSGGSVRTSYATGDVDGDDRVGGLVGSNYDTVTTSYATGSVTGTSRVGGLVGGNYGGTVGSAYATGSVDGSSLVGGFVGDSTGTVTTSYWDTQRSGQTAGLGSGTGSLTGLDTTEMQGSWASNGTGGNMSGLDFAADWMAVAGDFPDLQTTPRTTSTPHFSAPDDTEQARILDDMVLYDGAYNVTSDKALQAIGRNSTTLSRDYRLVVDVDASGTTSWNGGAGFEPIAKDTNSSKGAYQGTAFTGSFDGAGHTVSGLSINRPSTDFVGLFSNTGSSADIDDIELEDVDIRGDEFVTGLSNLHAGSMNQSSVTGIVAGNYSVSGLTNTNGGTVSQSYTTSTVTGISRVSGLIGINSGTVSQSYAVSTVSGNRSAGLIRENRGSVTRSYATGNVSSNTSAGGLIRVNNGRVNRSYATGNVTGYRDVGGLVGRNRGQIRHSYATGAVSGTYSVGGLVGYSLKGTINQSYATGTVSGDANIGGLVGYSNEGSLNRSYATGTVSGTTNLGGIVGNGYLYSIDGSYWDVGTTGQTNATGTSTGTTSTLIGFGDVTDTGPAPEMQRFAPAATMTAFDFESTWNLTSSYPRLSWEGATPITVDSLTASNQTITAGNSGTITVTATESGGDAGEGVTIEVIANDSLGGLLNGTMTVTNADGTATFSFTENTASTYGVTLAWVDDSTVNASPVVTVASRPSNNNGGGGGGSGGGSPDAADVAVSTEPGDDETTGSTVTVTGAKAGQPVAVVREDGEPLAQGDDSSVDGLSVTTNTDRDFSVSVRSHEDLDENNPEGTIALSRETDGADPIEYMTIDHDLDDEEITEASITFSVTEDDLEGPPSGVTLFRNVDGAWVPLETSLVRETDAGAQYEAITPGFSVFAIGGNDPPDDEQSTDSPPDESTAESRTDDEAPGFGLLVGLVSVLAVALMLRRRTRHRM